MTTYQNLYEILTRYSDVGWVSKKVHPDFPELALFGYTKHTEFNRYWDVYTARARGLVLHEDGTPVNNPMPKFWNLHEYGVRIPSGPFRTFAKLDGSMLVLSQYQGQPIWNTKLTFTAPQVKAARSWFESTYGADHGYDWMEPGHTYTFEWIAPENRITVNYGPQRGLFLLSDRGLDGTEYPLEESGWQGGSALHYSGLDNQPFWAIKDCIEENEEGFVLLFDSGERVKIKSEEWLRLHRTRWALSERRVWELLACYPEKYEETRAELADDAEAAEWFDNVAYRLKQEFDDRANAIGMRANHVGQGIERKEVVAQLKPWTTEDISLGDLLAAYDEKWDKVERSIWKTLRPDHKPFVPSRSFTELPS